MERSPALAYTTYVEILQIINENSTLVANGGRIRDIDTCPLFQKTPDPRELGADSDFTKIHHFLWFTRASLQFHRNGEHRSPVRLFDLPISHVTGKEKANWTGNDMYKFKCFSYFFTSKLQPDETIRVALFCTKTQSWVGEDWRNTPYHAWVGLLQPLTRGGYRVIIWDGNVRGEDLEGMRNYRDLPINMQTRFVEECKRRYNVGQLLLIGDSRGNPDGLCLQQALTRCQEILTLCNGWPDTLEGFGVAAGKQLRVDRVGEFIRRSNIDHNTTKITATQSRYKSRGRRRRGACRH